MQRNYSYKGVIFDTDLGGDVDDEWAIAIMEILKQSQYHLHGLTTVHTEPEIKAQMASLIMNECGYPDVPVYAGIGCTRSDSIGQFKAQCPLFPEFFGYPPMNKIYVPESITVSGLAMQMVLPTSSVISEMKDLNMDVTLGDNTELKQQDAINVASAMGFKAVESKEARDPVHKHKPWYHKFAKAYKDKYDLNQFKVEAESAPQMIARVAEQYSPENKLTIVAIGPLHNIDAALQINPKIANNIKMVSMGGLHPLGYNWLIAPHVTARVLAQVETSVITSHFINNNNFKISKQEIEGITKNTQSKFGKAFLQSCQNWYRGDFFKKDGVFLYDPLTFYLAINPQEVSEYEEKTISFPCLDEHGQLKPEYKGKWYSDKTLENQITQVIDSKTESKTDATNLVKVRFISKVKSLEKIRNDIFTIVTQKITASSAKLRTVKLINDARSAFLSEVKHPNVRVLDGVCKVFTKQINGLTYRVFGVPVEDQKKDFAHVRNVVSQELEFKEQKDFIQLIGDSQNFSEEGTAFCRQHLAQHLETEDKDSIVLYGYTGHKTDDGKLADTNQILSDWVDEKPERANRVIANVVDLHTPAAIQHWGCSISENVRNFYLVYSNGPKATVTFGKDTETSDGITNKRTICYDGGIQSIKQISGLLDNNVPVDCFSGLRDLNNPRNYENEDKNGKLYYSASDFYFSLNKKTQEVKRVTDDVVQSFVTEYKQTRAMTSLKMQDGLTKPDLLSEGLNLISKKQLWNKFSLLSFRSVLKPVPTKRFSAKPIVLGLTAAAGIFAVGCKLAPAIGSLFTNSESIKGPKS